MKYEKTGNKVNKDTGNNAIYSMVKSSNSSVVIWALIRKHKVGLLGVWAVLMTIYALIPFVYSELFALVSSII